MNKRPNRAIDEFIAHRVKTGLIFVEMAPAFRPEHVSMTFLERGVHKVVFHAKITGADTAEFLSGT